MRIRGLLFIGFGFVFGMLSISNLQAELPFQSGTTIITEVDGGGGDDGDKKKKREKKKNWKKGNRDKDDHSMKDAKTSNASSKPSQHARNSAKEARYAQKVAQKQIMSRAKVRMFFHNMFNTKYGKPVNFRKRRNRNRWSRGRSSRRR